MALAAGTAGEACERGTPSRPLELRVVTYNVHRCLGTDGQLSPQRIAEVIALFEPDLVALQELDVGRMRTGAVDQAYEVAHQLGMTFHFHPAFQVMEELYGDAILTPSPCTLVKAGPLPSLPGRLDLEPRGALWAAVEADGVTFQVINTHLGLPRRERLAQIEALLGPEWLGHEACRDPLILIGDFNTLPRSRAYRRLTRHLVDAQRAQPDPKPRPTFPARLPMLRIDHVFVSSGVEVASSAVPRTPLTRVASDHLPLVLDLRIVPPSARAAAHPRPGREQLRGQR
jgi:endonuclease/exonuclease/phosphatase family metal-dependent hydrolase